MNERKDTRAFLHRRADEAEKMKQQSIPQNERKL